MTIEEEKAERCEGRMLGQNKTNGEEEGSVKGNG